MLTHRTNVLLTKDQHATLALLAREHNKTMGELIRVAVDKTYTEKIQNDAMRESLTRIRKLTRGVRVTKQELRGWVVEGRKYEN